MPADDEAQASLKRGSKGLEESIAAYDAKEYEDAERKLRATLKELHLAVGAMSTCMELCEATALYAAVLHQRGDIEEAKLHLIDLMALSPTFELSPKRYIRDFIALRGPGGHRPQRGAARQRDGEVPPLGRARLRGRRVPGLHADDAADDADGQAHAAAGSPRLPPARAAHGGDAGRMRRSSPSWPPPTNYKKYDAQVDKVATEIIKTTPSQASIAMGKALSIDRGPAGHGEGSGPQRHRAGGGLLRLAQRQEAGEPARGAPGRRVRPGEVGDGAPGELPGEQRAWAAESRR